MSYCNECPNHDACDTGCVLGAARRSPTPSHRDVLEGALRNCLGLADGIRENSKDEASRKVAGWIVEHCRAILTSPSSETREKCGRCGKTDEGGCMEIPCPLGARTSMRELEEQLRQWYVAASPYATPNALKEALASVPSAIEPTDAYKDAVAMNLRLRKALEQCVLVCREWHAMPKRPGEDDAFDLYFNHSPEMKLIRDVLGKMPEPA